MELTANAAKQKAFIVKRNLKERKDIETESKSTGKCFQTSKLGPALYKKESIRAAGKTDGSYEEDDRQPGIIHATILI